MNPAAPPLPTLLAPLFAEKLSGTDIAVAGAVASDFELNAAPESSVWQQAPCIVFERNWQDQRPDSGRRTAVRLLWSPHSLYLRFDCRFRSLHVFDGGAEPDGRRQELWLRDVAEAFIQADLIRMRNYREFEISPNGMWLELDIFPGGNNPHWASGMRRAVEVHPAWHVWTAELAIPLPAFTAHFDPRQAWRVNFFRVEGDPQIFNSWRPTFTPRPNFHVPSAFAPLHFRD